MKVTLKLPARVDVELDNHSVAAALAELIRPFIPVRYRSVDGTADLRRFVTDADGNLYFSGDDGPDLAVRSSHVAALVDAWWCLRHERLDHIPTPLAGACRAVLEFADNGTPIQPGSVVISDLREALGESSRS